MRSASQTHGEGQVFPPPYDEGGLSAAAALGCAPPYCIETGRSLLPGGHRDGSRPGDLYLQRFELSTFSYQTKRKEHNYEREKREDSVD